MEPRPKLQDILENLMRTSGVPEDCSDYHVYFQPPMSLKLRYPCIRYERSTIDSIYADNSPYRQKMRYTLTFISRDPDDPIVMKIASLPLCSHDRFYTADNLNHDVYDLYF